MGNAIEPVPHHGPRLDGGGPPDEDQEGRLQRIFRILLLAEHATAYAPDHPAVPVDEGLYGLLVASAEKVFEQLPVSQRRTLRQTCCLTERSEEALHVVAHRSVSS